MATAKKCVFCGNEIGPGTGKMLVDHSGTVSFFCSSKCEKNVFLKRSSRKIKWTQAYRKEKDIRVEHLADKKDEDAKAPKAEKPKDEKPKAENPKAEKAKTKPDSEKKKA